MKKKIVITESQLKKLVESTSKEKKSKSVEKLTESKKEKLPQTNESVEKIKADFKRFM